MSMTKFNSIGKSIDVLNKDSMPFDSISTAPTATINSTMMKSDLTKESVSGN